MYNLNFMLGIIRFLSVFLNGFDEYSNLSKKLFNTKQVMYKFANSKLMFVLFDTSLPSP